MSLTPILTFPKFRAFDAAGLPLAFGKVYTYVANTTTPLATYTDSAGVSPNANPVILDINGEAVIRLLPEQGYKIVLKSSIDVTQWTMDDVYSDYLTQAQIGALLYPRTPAEIAAGVTPVNYAIPSHEATGGIFLIERYGTNTTPGTTDMASTINSAITVANTAGGGTVLCRPTIYKAASAIVQKTGVTLAGSGYGTQLLSSVAGSQAITVNSATNWAIENIRLTGSGTASGQGTYGIYISNASSKGHIQRCTVDTCYIGIGADSATLPSSSSIDISFNTFTNIGLNGVGINSQGSQYSICNNLFSGCGTIATNAVIGSAIEARGIVRSVIANNICRDGVGASGTSVDGIRVEYMTENSGQQITDVAITGNVIGGNSGFGIRLQYTLACTVSGNTIRGATSCAGGITVLGDNTQSKASSYNSITGNVITGVVGTAGIYLTGDTANPCLSNTISGNVVRACGYGMYVANANENIVSSNTFADNTNQGVYHASGTDNVLSANLASGNGAAGYQLVSSSSHVVLHANRARSNTGKGIQVDNGATNCVLTANTSQSNTAGNWAISDTTVVNLQMDENGLGFFQAIGATKQTVTGAKGGNAALSSLMTALTNYGIVTDTTT